MYFRQWPASREKPEKKPFQMRPETAESPGQPALRIRDVKRESSNKS